MSCGDSLEPPESTPGRFAVTIAFDGPVAPLIAIDRARVTATSESDGSVAIDTIISLAGLSFPFEHEFTVPVTASNGSFEAEIRVVTSAGDTVFGAGPISITPTTSGAPASVTATLVYRGPGADAVSISIEEAAATLFFGQELTFTAVTRTASGAVINGSPIEWTSLDGSIAQAPHVLQGRVVGAAQRGAARIRARLLNGAADTVAILLQPTPSAVTIETGGSQSATVGTALAQPVVARVTAADDLGVENVWVHFATATGNGTVAPESSLTDANGRAQATWTLGTGAGGQSLNVSADGVATPAVAGATAQPGAPATTTIHDGNGQTATVGTAVTIAPAVFVRDAFGNPVPGVSVTFAITSGGGSLTGASPVTDASGIARVTSWTLGTQAGPNALSATVAPGSTALVAAIGATASPGGVSTATSLVTVSAGSVASGSQVTLTLRARDAAGNNLTGGGLNVQFTTAGGSSTGTIGATTDHGNGTYTATFTGIVAGTPTTLGATIGVPAVTSTLPTIEVIPGPVASVVVTPGPTTLTAFGATRQFTAQARDANTNVVPGQVFVWTSQSDAVATVDATGLATAVTNGTVQVRATTASVTGHANLTIGQVVAQVVVTPGPTTLTAIGATRQFTAEARDANNHPIAGQAFVWSSADNAVAMVDAGGLATAAANGTVEIRATTSGITGHAGLTIGQVVAQVVVSPGPVTLTAVGATQQFTASARDANNNVVAGQAFVWTSADNGTATVDANGLATAASNGTVEVRATTAGVTGHADLTVAQAVAQVLVTPGPATITALGATSQFTASARDANNNVVAGQAFVWTSQDGNVATVNATGLATAASNGITEIRATTSGITGHADLTVGQTVTQVVVTPGPATLGALGATQQFTASARDANNNVVAGQGFVWTTEDGNIATVNATGLATAVANGGVEIRATTSGVTGHADLTVVQVVSQVNVTPGPASIAALGATRQFAAEARDANNNPVAGQLFVWSSANEATATVNGTGLATAVANGTVEIRATTASVTGHADLTVAQVVTQVVVTSGPVTLTAVGAQQQFTASARDANSQVVTGQAFVWSSEDNAVATVNGTGLVTAAANGEAEIRATTAGITGHADLTVAQSVTAVIVTPGPTALNAFGVTRQFAASARDANNNAVNGQVFVWTSEDDGIATVDAAGLAMSVANGGVEIRATTAGVTGHADLTVAQVVTQVVVTPSPTTLTAFGATRQFAAQARDANNQIVAGQAFAWTSEDDNIATVEANGLATAVANGTVEIRATTSGVTGHADLTVGQTVAELIVTPDPATLSAVGATQQFTAVARDANSNVVAGQGFVWTSEDEDVATVDATGLATAVANGQVEIRATGGGITGHADLTVAQVVTQVVVTPTPVTLTAFGATQQFTASARDANNNVVAGQAFVWTSEDDNIASVSGTGLATAVANGTAEIRATTAGITGHADLTVAQVVTAVVVTPGPVTLNALDATQQFAASARDANNHVVAGQAFVWTSADDDIATVNATGLATAVADGTVEIRATTAGITGHADLTVAQVVTEVVVTPNPVTLAALAATQQFTAEARDANSNPVAGQAFVWTSEDDDIATVNGTGLATAVANGDVGIRATTAGVTGHADLTVEQVITEVVVTPSAVTVASIGARQQFQAEARDANGHPVAGQLFVWTSADDDIGTVDGNGLATAVDNGTVEIRATTASITGHGDLTVEQVATQLAFAVQPGNSIAGASITPSPQVSALDGLGHVVTTDDATQIALAIVDGSGAPGAGLSGTATQTVVDGVATFADLSINFAGSGYRLVAASGTFPTDESTPFVIMPVGTTKLWTGASTTAWANALNWSPAGVPLASDNIFVQASVANPPTLTTNASANNLIVESGATLNLSTFTLTAAGNVDGGHTIVGAGTLQMTGVARTLRGTVPALSVSGTVSLTASTTTGNVQVTGNLSLAGHTLTVNGEFRTTGNGTLQMPAAMPNRLTVRDSAIFAGGAENSLLRHGLIQVAGNFRQSSVTSTTSFVSIAGFGDTLITELNGTSAQHLQFDTPTDVGSGFAYLRLVNSSPGGIVLETDLFVQQRVLTVWDGTPRYVFGQGHTFTARGDSIRSVVFDNVPHMLPTNPVLSRALYFETVTFQNYDPNVDQLTIFRPTNGGTYNNVTWTTVPNAGVGSYIRAIDTNASTLQMTILLNNPFPFNSGGLIKLEGQAPGAEARIHRLAVPPVDW